MILERAKFWKHLKLKYMEESGSGGKRPASMEDLKKWYMEECDKNLKLEEEIKRLKEVIKVLATYITNI